MSKPVIIDVREENEYASGHVQGAINVPLAELQSGGLPDAVDSLERDKAIILYCKSGGRASSALNVLNQHGFSNLRNGNNKSETEKILGL